MARLMLRDKKCGKKGDTRACEMKQISESIRMLTLRIDTCTRLMLIAILTTLENGRRSWLLPIISPDLL